MAETLELARQLIARPSITPDDQGCQDLLEAELKAAGFVVDGVKLPGYAICNLAKSVQDFDYIKSLSPAEGMEGPEIYFACVFDDILDMSDATAAKAKITEIINFLAKKKLFESKYMAQAKAVNSIITARLVDGKILGK